MKVLVAEEAGFCFGVKRALKIINQLYNKGNKVQIYGQLIHNKIVINDLARRGIHCIESLEKLDANKILVIRTHGIPREVKEELKKKKINYVDATCPLVNTTHNIIKGLDQQQTKTIIIGDKNHPEIIATKSYCQQALVINSEKEAQKLRKIKKMSVIAQTTLEVDFFKRMLMILLEKAEVLEIFNTICSATKERQQAVQKLAPTVDFVIVIGGKNSSNTKKLYDISLSSNKNTFYFEKSSDIKKNQFWEKVKHFKSAGITAGASTPFEEIENVKKCLETKPY